MVEAGGEHQCVGVLYLERREGTQQETDHLLLNWWRVMCRLWCSMQW